ncbi:MAG: hypothetical protein WC554_13845 [Clostridia bacterium]
MSKEIWKRILGALAAIVIFYGVIKAISSLDVFELYFTTLLFLLALPTIIGQFFLAMELIKLKRWAWITFSFISLFAVLLGWTVAIILGLKFTVNSFFYSFFGVSLVVIPVLGVSYIIRKIIRKI